MLGISHVVDPVQIDESPQAGEDPEPFAQRLAREKAVAGSKRHPGKWVLGADTIVVLDKETLGKPSSPDEAEEMLLRLAGKCHRVVSAVALAREEDVYEAHDVTSVWMRSVSRETIRPTQRPPSFARRRRPRVACGASTIKIRDSMPFFAA